MFQNDTGIGKSGAKIETFSANTLVPPKNNEANVIVIGLYLPKINAANAKYPNPYTVIAALNPWENVVAMIAPANPAKHPEINTPMYRYLNTFNPSESLACGFSPTERKRNPNGRL